MCFYIPHIFSSSSVLSRFSCIQPVAISTWYLVEVYKVNLCVSVKRNGCSVRFVTVLTFPLYRIVVIGPYIVSCSVILGICRVRLCSLVELIKKHVAQQ